MFSAEHERMVLVIAPLLFICADNPRHAEVCGIKMPSSVYPCRKCYQMKYQGIQATNEAGKRISKVVPLDTILLRYDPRTRQDYELASSGTYNEIPLRNGISAVNLCYKDTGSYALLLLSFFDPAMDRPVEVLHTILLGAAKYLVKYLVKNLLDKPSLDRLTAALKKHESSPAYSRTFRHKLQYCGSFLGWDFKQLIQILPIMEMEFSGPGYHNAQLMIPVFKRLGLLSSLVFVRAIHANAERYILNVQEAVVVLWVVGVMK
ncbi:hypothetical protein [Absidia glauca]|uniref:Uncharacterized protein n=1 Tax=Absidia glauca TaxID=4829 RepID=A0A163JNK7_ABSGL|nr:hypothetical protein [Absidia glauca]